VFDAETIAFTAGIMTGNLNYSVPSSGGTVNIYAIDPFHIVYGTSTLSSLTINLPDDSLPNIRGDIVAANLFGTSAFELKILFTCAVTSLSWTGTGFSSFSATPPSSVTKGQIVKLNNVYFPYESGVSGWYLS
jgi:hypothetical protein